MKKLILIISVMLFSCILGLAGGGSNYPDGLSTMTQAQQKAAGLTLGKGDFFCEDEAVFRGMTKFDAEVLDGYETQIIVTASSETTIIPTKYKQVINCNVNAIDMAALPLFTIGVMHQRMVVYVSSNNWTISDNDTLAGSLTELTEGTTLTMSKGEWCYFLCDGTSWLQDGFVKTLDGNISTIGTMQAEQLTSTDDAEINDQLNFGTGMTSKNIKNDTSNYDLSISTHVNIEGNGDVDGTLNVDGATTLKNCDVNGSLLLDVTEITTTGLPATQTLTTTQSGYIVVAATEAVTLNLPAVSGNAGLSYTVKLDSVAATAVYAVTLDGDASELIDGATTNNQIDNWFDYLTIYTDGDEWFIGAEKEH